MDILRIPWELVAVLFLASRLAWRLCRSRRAERGKFDLSLLLKRFGPTQKCNFNVFYSRLIR